jgi:DNA-binding GntR family transcriptional regulator
MRPKNVAVMEKTPSLVERSTLSTRIYALLKHRILTCALLPGQRMMERELCREPGITRTPLREAISRLVLEGLVSETPYCGYTVAPITFTDMREMCELRRVVEVEVAVLASKRATPEEVTNLRKLAPVPYAHGDRATYESYLKGNSAFHQMLARCAHNTRLEGVAIQALELLQRPLFLVLDVGELDSNRSTLEHLTLVGAIEAHHPSRARREMTYHVDRATEMMLVSLQKLSATQLDGSTVKDTSVKAR